jgi:hypothetical protein
VLVRWTLALAHVVSAHVATEALEIFEDEVAIFANVKTLCFLHATVAFLHFKLDRFILENGLRGN